MVSQLRKLPSYSDVLPARLLTYKCVLAVLSTKDFRWKLLLNAIVAVFL